MSSRVLNSCRKAETGPNPTLLPVSTRDIRFPRSTFTLVFHDPSKPQAFFLHGADHAEGVSAQPNHKRNCVLKRCPALQGSR